MANHKSKSNNQQTNVNNRSKQHSKSKVLAQFSSSTATVNQSGPDSSVTQLPILRHRPRIHGPTYATNFVKISLFISILSFAFVFISQLNQLSQHGADRNTNLEKSFAGVTVRWLAKIKNVFHRADTDRIKLVSEKLKLLENSVSVRKDARIAIGLGSCIDMVVSALDVFHNEPVPKGNGEPLLRIDNMLQLLKLFTYYFRFGAASE